MNNDRMHAHQFQQHHISGEIGLQGRVCHGISAVFDDNGFAVELANVGERPRQDLCLIAVRLRSRCVCSVHGSVSMMSGIVHQARGRDKTHKWPKLSQINLSIIYIWLN